MMLTLAWLEEQLFVIIKHWEVYDKQIWNYKEWYQDFQKDELCHHCKGPWERGHKCKREIKNYRYELKRKKKLCFHCKESWEPGHMCGKRSQVRKMDATFDEEANEKVNKRSRM